MKKVFIAFIIVLMCTQVFSDTIELKNGDILSGSIVSYNNAITVITTKYGEISVPNKDINRIIIEPKLSESSNIKMGLVAEYLFSDNATDSSGNANHGTIKNATSTYDRFGNKKSAYLFDGKNSYIEIRHSPTLDLSDNYSISTWIKPMGIENNGGIIAKNKVGNDQYFLYYESSVSIMFEQNNRDSWKRSNSKLHMNDWNHIVVIVRNNTISIFINGKLDSSSPQNTMPTQRNEYPVLIGASGRSTDNGTYFNGAIDDIRIYNRSITEEEIKILYSERTI